MLSYVPLSSAVSGTLFHLFPLICPKFIVLVGMAINFIIVFILIKALTPVVCFLIEIIPVWPTDR